MELTSITPDPVSPFHLIVMIAVAVVVLLTWIRFFLSFRRSTRGRWTTRLAAALLTTLAGLCFIGAVYNPLLRQTSDDGEARHLAVVIDSSGSVQRTDGGWGAVTAQTRAFLDVSLSLIPEALLDQTTASLIVFQDRASVFQGGAFPVRQLLRNLDALDADTELGGGSNIAAGLDTAGDQIAANGGRGEILLVTDGNQLSGDSEASAQRLSQRGIAVTVLPITSGSPELAIQSVYLPARVESGTLNSLRFVVFNGGDTATSSGLSIARNIGLNIDDLGMFDNPAQTLRVALTLDREGLAAQPYPIIFEGMGLQYVDVSLYDQADSLLHQRRLFTYVNRPLRLLGIGGDFTWVNAISPDFAEVVQMYPSDFNDQVNLGDYDALILGAVAADQFTAEQIDRIVTGVRDDGMGLLLINGNHGGASEEADTVIRSYVNAPALDALLPVSSEPRPFAPNPPPRHVVMVIDSSGSMNGWRLDKAKQIADWIIRTHMRPIDVLDVVVFTTTALHLVDAENMTLSEQDNAIRAINSVSAGGGTDPRAALDLIRNSSMTNCGMIFLSDGDFDSDFRNQVGQYRPDCRAAVFTINEFGISPEIQSILQGNADAVHVNINFDPASIVLPFFDNPVRNKFFEAGAFSPLSLLTVGRRDNILTFPNFNMNGAAITYPRENTDLYAVRPLYIDPILAYNEAGAGYVGVFTGAIDNNLVTTPEGAQAVQSWIRLVVPYAARDRYRFNLTDEGDRLALTIEVQPTVSSESLAQIVNVPQVNSLNVTLRVDGRSEVVRMCPQSVRCDHATFTGFIETERVGQAQRGILVIQESGADRLLRPQRIPILIPARMDASRTVTDETLSYGLNSELLHNIVEITNGRYNPVDGYPFFELNTSQETLAEYWNGLLLAGMAFYLGAIFVCKVLK